MRGHCAVPRAGCRFVPGNRSPVFRMSRCAALNLKAVVEVGTDVSTQGYCTTGPHREWAGSWELSRPNQLHIVYIVLPVPSISMAHSLSLH